MKDLALSEDELAPSPPPFAPEHLRAITWHGRTGGPRNAFRYSVDYLLLDPDSEEGPALFSVDRPNAFSLRRADHGGPPGAGAGAAWARTHLPGLRVLLLAQPRVLGHVFNPVSFWLGFDAQGRLRGVIAEVTNTYGDRHSYLVRHPEGRVIGKRDVLEAEKILHVSPFLRIKGRYRFAFDIGAERIAIRIEHLGDTQGLVATLTGVRRPLGNAGILAALLRRPFGSRRVLALIHWQALKLWWKGARFRSRPAPPDTEIS